MSAEIDESDAVSRGPWRALELRVPGAGTHLKGTLTPSAYPVAAFRPLLCIGTGSTTEYAAHSASSGMRGFGMLSQ